MVLLLAHKLLALRLCVDTMSGRMGMRFQILGSSSSGNCSLIETDNSKVLIDAGFSGRKINTMLQEHGHDLDQIDAVFLTHEHSDHTAGLCGIAKYKDLVVYANHGTAQAAQARLKKPANWKIFETGRNFKFKDIEVSSFSIPHDAHDPVGFIFEAGEENSLFCPKRRLCWLTDLGYLAQGIKQRVSNVDLLVLEANYDAKLLENDTRRPWSLKQRISGRHGHLSNEDCFNFLHNAEGTRWSQVCLAHLSRDCNDIALIENKLETLAQSRKGFKVDIVNPGQAVDNFYNLYQH